MTDQRAQWVYLALIFPCLLAAGLSLGFGVNPDIGIGWLWRIVLVALFSIFLFAAWLSAALHLEHRIRYLKNRNGR